MYYFQYFQFYESYHSEICIKIRWHQEIYDFTIYADQQWLYLVEIPKQKQKNQNIGQSLQSITILNKKTYSIAIKGTAKHC